jgi:hypothetical protein
VEGLGYLFLVLHRHLQEPVLLVEQVIFLTQLFHELKIQALDVHHMMMTMTKVTLILLKVAEELLCTETASLSMMDH